MDKKDKINLDLDFLGKDIPKANSDKPVHHAHHKKSETADSSKSLSDGAKKWLTGLVIVGVVLLIGYSMDDTSTSISSEDNLVQVGQYLCSQYHHDRAGNLEPSSSEGLVLEGRESKLALRDIALMAEKRRLEGEYVDEYDEYAVNAYNARIDNFNERLQGYRNEVEINSNAIDAFNAKIEIYNNYLIANCTPAR
jgi:hypothetical protein